MIESYTLVEYMQQADLLLENERARLEKCLCWPNFDTKLLAVFQEEILMKYQMQLLNSDDGGIFTLFRENNFEVLKLLYKLYYPVKDGLKLIAEKFKFQLTETGKSLLQNTETTSNGKDLPLRTILVNSQLVEKVIDTLVHFRGIITNCFNADSLFDRNLQISFQDFLNLDVGKFSMAELLA